MGSQGLTSVGAAATEKDGEEIGLAIGLEATGKGLTFLEAAIAGWLWAV